MHPQHVDIASLSPSPPGLERLPQVERVAPSRSGAAPAPSPSQSEHDGSAFEIPVLDDGPTAVVTVRYALDRVARTWVAHVFDAESGDLLRAVPATEYHHQMALLAALRPRSIDARA